MSAPKGRPASERVRLNLPHGSGRSLAMCAAAVAYDFATEFIDRPRGRNHLVIYPEIAAGYCAAVWWTDTGSVSVQVRRGAVLSAPLTITSPAGVEVVSHGGMCPVQAYGTIGAFHWYFRARGTGWRLSVGGPDPRGQHYVDADTADLTVSGDYGGDYGGGYDAGYMPDDDVAERIGLALDLWQSGVRGYVEEADDHPPPEVWDAWAEECDCGCLECGMGPCGGVQAGGLCDGLPCRCDPDINVDDIDRGDEDWEDDDNV